MRKFSVVVTVMALFLLVVPAVPAGATPPSDVTIVETTNTTPGPPVPLPFVATGAAVDEGILCGSGVQFDAAIPKFTGFQSGKGVNIKVVKQFICNDGSGTFQMALEIREDKRGNRFNWKIVNGSGTGDYVRLRGTGKGTGEYIGINLIEDTYDGKLHND